MAEQASPLAEVAGNAIRCRRGRFGSSLENMSMKCGLLRLVLFVATAVVLVSAPGCPSSTPPARSKGSGSGSPSETAGGLKDNVDDVAALKAAKAALKTDSSGHVIEVELDRTGGDKDLAHLKGLTNARILSAVEV